MNCIFQVVEHEEADFVVLSVEKPNNSEMIPEWLVPEISDPWNAQIYDLSEDEILLDPGKIRFRQHVFNAIFPTFQKEMKLKGLDVFETVHPFDPRSFGGMSLDLTVLSKECRVLFNVDFVLAFSCQIKSLDPECMPRTFYAINQIMKNPSLHLRLKKKPNALKEMLEKYLPEPGLVLHGRCT